MDSPYCHPPTPVPVEATKVYYLWRSNLSDESDNHLIELAVACGAEFIVTRNLRDLQGSQMHFPSLRLKAQANSRGTPLNRSIDEMTTLMLAEFDAETCFQIRSARGAGQEARGLQLLDKAMGV